VPAITRAKNGNILLLSSRVLAAFDGVIRAVLGSVLIVLATIVFFIFIDDPFSWLTTTTVVTLLYVKGLFLWFGAYRSFTAEPAARWNAFLSPLQWRISAIGFGLVSLLFAISTAAEEGAWLIAGTLVYGALTYGCLVAANKPV